MTIHTQDFHFKRTCRFLDDMHLYSQNIYISIHPSIHFYLYLSISTLHGVGNPILVEPPSTTQTNNGPGIIILLCCSGFSRNKISFKYSTHKGLRSWVIQHPEYVHTYIHVFTVEGRIGFRGVNS